MSQISSLPPKKTKNSVYSHTSNSLREVMFNSFSYSFFLLMINIKNLTHWDEHQQESEASETNVNNASRSLPGGKYIQRKEFPSFRHTVSSEFTEVVPTG